MNPVSMRIRCFAAIGLFLLSPAVFSQAEIIRFKGTDSLGAKLIPQLVEAYKGVGGKDVTFEISAEGSGTAIPALIDGTAEIGMVFPKPKPEKLAEADARGIKLREIPCCSDLLAVVVNEGNPIRNLTREQVEKIFTGELKDWSEVGGHAGKISVYTPNSSTGRYRDWQRMAMNGRGYSGNRKLPPEESGPAVAADPNGVTYLGLALAKMKGVHTVSIDGIEPVAVDLWRYAYRRDYCLYVREDAPDAVRGFLDFVKSDEGRRIVEKVGFFPFKAEWDGER